MSRMDNNFHDTYSKLEIILGEQKDIENVLNNIEKELCEHLKNTDMNPIESESELTFLHKTHRLLSDIRAYDKDLDILMEEISKDQTLNFNENTSSQINLCINHIFEIISVLHNRLLKLDQNSRQIIEGIDPYLI